GASSVFPAADTESPPEGEQNRQMPQEGEQNLASGEESAIADALLVEEVQEEVRPFTDFIEEFRQAETRFNSSLQAYEAESLSLLTTTAEEVAGGSAADSATEASTINDAGDQSITPAEVPAEQEEEQVPTPPAEQEGETQ